MHALFAMRGRYDAKNAGAVDICAIYWYFVDWPVLFVLVYLTYYREGVLMMRSNRLLTIATGLTPLLVTVAPRLANACAVCGLDGNGADSLAFKHSVLFMISAPYLAFAVIAGTMYMAWRKARPRFQSAGMSSQTTNGSVESRGETL